MYRDYTVAAVVPAHNEKLLIGRVIETMPGYVDYIIVVDDASRDRTVEVVRRYLPRMGKRLYLIQHEANQGVGWHHRIARPPTRP